MPGLKVNRVSATYLHQLACAYHRIAKRGLLMDVEHLSVFEKTLTDRIITLCGEISTKWNCKVYLGNMKMDKGDVNLNAPKQLIAQLTKLGYKVPKKRGTEDETAEQLAMLKLFSETNDEGISKVLEINRIKTVLNRYVKARLYDNQFFCQYNVAGTLSGRRGSKKHVFGYGNNSQNFPKYTDLGKEFRECIIARPGKIFFAVDQKQAEDWPVSALAGNNKALEDLRNGVDRHKKLAAFLFSIPESEVKKHPHRFLGKKFRHANNYGMWKNTASENLAKEGFAFTPDECAYLLKKTNEHDPSIKAVFHPYIEKCLNDTRMLVTPFGRERIFLGLRPKDNNNTIFMEAYSYIPQSCVGDNTGFSVLYLDSLDAPIVQENHDSIVLEIDENWDEMRRWRDEFVEAFDRPITFHNGITVKIPLEGEVGYDLKNTAEIETSAPLFEITDSLLKEAYEKAKEKRDKRLADAKKTTNSVAGSVS